MRRREYLDNIKNKIFQKKKDSVAPFNCTAIRKIDSDIECLKDNPGPGQYIDVCDPKNSSVFSKQVKYFKEKGNAFKKGYDSNSFGINEKRFQGGPSTKTPGPGAYQLPQKSLGYDIHLERARA